ncbi:MAG TPA: response regulator transcription factor [Actinocrinis sp.]|jgi:DNA-binding NarL/FixJ family response regulator
MTISVLLADDQALVRAGFRAVIEAEPDMRVVGEAEDGAQAVQLARSTRADIVLMDIRMPRLDGIAATRAIAEDGDLAGIRILILTTFELDDYVFQALRAGASGFLGKGSRPPALLDAIRTVTGGDALLSPAATRAVIARALAAPPPAPGPAGPDRFAALTGRERELVVRVARGGSNEEIAQELSLSPLTVKTHVNRAMAKLGVRDRAQLVVLAYQAGVVRVSDA